ERSRLEFPAERIRSATRVDAHGAEVGTSLRLDRVPRRTLGRMSRAEPPPDIAYRQLLVRRRLREKSDHRLVAGAALEGHDPPHRADRRRRRRPAQPGYRPCFQLALPTHDAIPHGIPQARVDRSVEPEANDVKRAVKVRSAWDDGSYAAPRPGRRR